MTNLFDRVRRALAPQYRLERELASGGMGIVYIGHDPALRRQVAIKLLRPELATATAAARFLREARLLAKLNHRAVVTIHQAGEADGLFYYVMELVGGETLADRIAAGVAFDEVRLVTLGRQLLDGLEAIHQLGIIHRDLKPANILFRGDQAVIADFGIALSDATTATEGLPPIPHAGTPAYMPPEQVAGDPIGPASDIYNVGMILVEAATGRRWHVRAPLDRGLFKEMPDRLIEPILKALAYDPADRWPSAREMSAALDAGGRTRRGWLAGGGIAGVTIAIVALLRGCPAPPPPGIMAIRVGPTRGARGIALESMTEAIQNRLAVNPDFHLTNGTDAHSVEIEPTVQVASGRVELRALVRGPALPVERQFVASLAEPGRWLELADSLADKISEALLLGESADRWLPLGARPTTPRGKAIWLRAEHAYRTGDWERADSFYREAESIDSSCLICVYRLNEVGRWLGRPAPPDRTRLLADSAHRFPQHYRALNRANALPWPHRFDSLLAAADANGDFALAWMAVGDEAFHRAPLHGRPRREALGPLVQATKLKPGFAPAWEHLVWLALALGDSGLASKALDSLGRTRVGGGFPAALRTLLNLGFSWRFLSEARAGQATKAVFDNPAIRAYPAAAAGPRVLMTMGSPNGALYFGRLFATDPTLAESGLIGALLGATALGKVTDAAEVRDQLRRTKVSPDLELFLDEWELVASEIDGVTDGEPARRRLVAMAEERLEPMSHRQRAAWLVALTAPDSLGDGAPSLPLGAMLGTVAAAAGEARRDNLIRALEMTDTIPTLDVTAPPDPFLPLMLRLRRSAWLERLGRLPAARMELRGFDHLHYNGFPTGPPQAGEVDWAFGPAIAWRRAAVLERIGAGNGGTAAELCQLYGEIVRLARQGAAWPAAGADSALSRTRALRCEAIR